MTRRIIIRLGIFVLVLGIIVGGFFGYRYYMLRHVATKVIATLDPAVTTANHRIDVWQNQVVFTDIVRREQNEPAYRTKTLTITLDPWSSTSTVQADDVAVRQDPQRWIVVDTSFTITDLGDATYLLRNPIINYADRDLQLIAESIQLQSLPPATDATAATHNWQVAIKKLSGQHLSGRAAPNANNPVHDADLNFIFRAWINDPAQNQVITTPDAVGTVSRPTYYALQNIEFSAAGGQGLTIRELGLQPGDGLNFQARVLGFNGPLPAVAANAPVGQPSFGQMFGLQSINLDAVIEGRLADATWTLILDTSMPAMGRWEMYLQLHRDFLAQLGNAANPLPLQKVYTKITNQGFMERFAFNATKGANIPDLALATTDHDKGAIAFVLMTPQMRAGFAAQAAPVVQQFPQLLPVVQMIDQFLLNRRSLAVWITPNQTIAWPEWVTMVSQQRLDALMTHLQFAAAAE